LKRLHPRLVYNLNARATSRKMGRRHKAFTQNDSNTQVKHFVKLTSRKPGPGGKLAWRI